MKLLWFHKDIASRTSPYPVSGNESKFFMAHDSFVMNHGLISFIEAKILDSNKELKFSIEKIYYEKYFNRSKTNISAPNVIDFNLHPYL